MSRQHVRKRGLNFTRINAVFVKELIQMRRDRLTFAVMLAIPILELVLFGYAINTDPKHLPTAVHIEEYTPQVRSIVTGLVHSEYFDINTEIADSRSAEHLLASGDAVFVIEIPSGFTKRLIRGERPSLLVAADATDPVAASNAIGRINTIVSQALSKDLTGALSHLQGDAGPVEVVVHPRYNPEGITQYNIVPGLLGVILTMTLVMITGVAMTRETERGTMENLLAMPGTPLEVMIGKILPFLGVGAVQTVIVLCVAHWMFSVPFVGSIGLLLISVALFIIANLALGFTFSTIAKTQIQAMQLTVFFFLPSMLLSGFMFPFRGMPLWAQIIGEGLPLTHFLRVVRGIMLKGAGFNDLRGELVAIVVFMVVVVLIAMLRYKRTLD
ncbi:putative multidrug ABC transporter permease YbhS [Zhongshania aliphaticivorans]|uniref:Putative multidrug ABC transporter permease YbhS n=1 Tax=Zhongshania aliphaticivorans TaxID=1470434 RepID=A0A5S9NKC9_9GAMM|nr:ABC transporter permease [Zhongshania aliphaticivorans]CAA0091130.1 putative multidrug ABC transporter permease YbhS [Zhongshania aliphaticivorans]CAA0098604.1 putative multidrug ABC transporter permease YbhS [Zhongshania aliphaticivorans]